jgi:hypothetical protein
MVKHKIESVKGIKKNLQLQEKQRLVQAEHVRKLNHQAALQQMTA